MAGCLWHVKRKNKTEPASNDFSPRMGISAFAKKFQKSPSGKLTEQLNHPQRNFFESNNEIWFDSRLVFESDSEDDFKSVNGDSLPSFSFPTTPRPTFASLKERMESLVTQGSAGEVVHSGPQSVPPSPSQKKTLAELFTSKPEEEKKAATEDEHHKHRQASMKGNGRDKSSHMSCLGGMPQLAGFQEKKLSSSPDAHKTKSNQLRLPFARCLC